MERMSHADCGRCNGTGYVPTGQWGKLQACVSESYTLRQVLAKSSTACHELHWIFVGGNSQDGYSYATGHQFYTFSSYAALCQHLEMTGTPATARIWRAC